MASIDDEFEFTSRYDAFDALPDRTTMCRGECQGTGWVPVLAEDGDPVYRALWLQAEALSKTEDGWHFVPCPVCKGTGTRQ